MKTKKEWYNILKEMVIESDRKDKRELVNFLDRQLELLQDKVDKERARVSKKRVTKVDTLKDKVLAAMTDQYQSLEEIYLEVLIVNADIDILSKEMIVPRLTKLIADDVIEKKRVKNPETGKRIYVYRLKQEGDIFQNEILH